MLKIHIYQDNDPPEISWPPDEESCGTTIRSLTGMSIYTVKSSKSPILQVQIIFAIFGLDYNTFYIEMEISSLNSSHSESEFIESTLSGGGFKRKEFYLAMDNIGEINFVAKNPYSLRKRSSRNFITTRRRKLRNCDKIAHRYINLHC